MITNAHSATYGLRSETWPTPNDRLYDVIFCINIFQVAPVSIADGMMQCAARILKDTGFLSIYGPFKVDGRYTTDSNESFDKEGVLGDG